MGKGASHRSGSVFQRHDAAVGGGWNREPGDRPRPI